MKRLVLLLGVVILIFLALGLVFYQNSSLKNQFININQIQKDKEIILKEAKDIEITNEEIDNKISDFLESNDITEEELEGVVGGSGRSMSEFREDVKEDLLIEKHLDEELDLSAVTVTDEEIQGLIGTGDEELSNVLENKLRERILVLKKAKLINDYMEGLN